MMFDPARRRDRLLLQALFGGGLIAAWMIAGFVSPRIFPFPWLIADALAQQVASGEMTAALTAALQAIVIGYLLAVAVGISIGLLMGLNHYFGLFLDTYLDSLYSLPFAAIIPAMIIWFGVGLQIRVIVVFFFAVFPIAITTLEGAQSIPRRLQELGQSYNAGRLDTIRYIVIPHELPYILSGLRLGSGLAVRGLVVTELLVAATGFGQLIRIWSAGFRMEGVISVILVLMALGILATATLGRMEELLVPWEVTDVEH